MLKKLYCWFYRVFSYNQKKGDHSVGYWHGLTRASALRLCRGAGERILEVGCGEGLFLEQLASDSPDREIYGVDNSRARLEKAQKRLQDNGYTKGKFFLEEATQLSFADQYFDAVVCINTLLNIRSFEAVKLILAQMKRVSKKEGKIIFEFRNAANPLLSLKYRLAPFYDPTVKNLYLHCYSLKQIEPVLAELGLEVKRKIFLGLAVFKRFAPVILIEAGLK